MLTYHKYLPTNAYNHQNNVCLQTFSQDDFTVITDLVQFCFDLMYMPSGGYKLYSCPGSLQRKFVVTICNNFLRAFHIMIQNCFITALMQKASFEFDIPLKMTPFFQRFPKPILCIFMNVKYSVFLLPLLFHFLLCVFAYKLRGNNSQKKSLNFRKKPTDFRKVLLTCFIFN